MDNPPICAVGMTVYVILYNAYGDTFVSGVYATLESAEANRQFGEDIEERELQA